MLPSNIETEVRKILQKHDGWLRVEQCAKEYAKGNGTKRTNFYRWRKKVEKGKVKGFQVLNFPHNVSFIGLESADPKALESFVFEDKKVSLSVKSSEFMFYLEHGLITKKEIDTYVALKTLLPVLPKDVVPYAKLLMMAFQNKLKFLKEK